MGKLNRGKLMLFGLLATLLVGIPTSLYLIKTQTENRSRAEKATRLSFLPASTATNPIKKAKGETVTLDINVDPGTNIVSFVKLEINYDTTKLATDSAEALQVNDTAFPVTLEGPAYLDGKILITLSVGSDPTKAIQTVTKAATLTLKAVEDTGDTPTTVTFGNGTEILSIGGNDQASENVLLSVDPASIQIGEASPTGGNVSPTTEPTSTTAPTSIPPTAVPPTAIPTSPVGSGPTGDPNQAPVCQSLNIDRDTTGGAPYSVTFTAVGSDADGTISKVTFNYGDGPVETVTESGGIGSNAISVQKSHTYNNPGTYQASVILTDSNNKVSDSETCKKTIIVLAPTIAGGIGGGDPTTAPGLTEFPTATIAKPGPGDVFIGVGALAAVLTVVGGFIFFAL